MCVCVCRKAQDQQKKVVLAGCVPQAQPRMDYLKGLSIIGVRGSLSLCLSLSLPSHNYLCLVLFCVCCFCPGVGLKKRIARGEILSRVSAFNPFVYLLRICVHTHTQVNAGWAGFRGPAVTVLLEAVPAQAGSIDLQERAEWSFTARQRLGWGSKRGE